MSFQENLRKYREMAGLTAKDLAAQIGMRYGTYVSYETAGKEPRYDTLKKIAAALHVSIDKLLEYETDELERWANYLNDTNINFIDNGEEITLVIGSDGVNSENISIPRKLLLQTLQVANKQASRTLAPAHKEILCNRLKDFLIYHEPMQLI